MATSASHPAAEVPGVDSDYDGPSRKRMRVSRACDACRRRKERCDGVQPSCQRCATTGRACTYNPFRKRGLRTGYVKGTEILLGLLIHSYQDAESLILSVLHHGTSLQDSARTSFKITAPVAVSLLDKWRRSAALEQLQKALATSDTDEDEESYIQDLDDRFTEAFNTVLRWDSSIRAHTPPTSVAPDDHLCQDVALFNVESPAPPSRIPLHEPLTPKIAAHKKHSLPSNWPFLIDVYLASTHCWFPVIEKHVLLRTASLLSHDTNGEGNGNSERPKPGEVVSLWATLALASHQLDIIDTLNGGLPKEQAQEALAPSQIHAVAKELAIQDPPTYDPGHIHGFLILSLFEICQGPLAKAWLWVGRAVYTATTLGIVSFPSQQAIETEPSGIRKRLLLGCFILDTLVSMGLGYRPYLKKTDLGSVDEITVDGLEEWEPWRPVSNPSTGASTSSSSGSGAPARALSVFNHLGFLAGVLNTMCHTLLDPTAEEAPAKLLDIFIHRLRNMSILNTTITGGSFEEAPHLKQLRIATAVTYTLINPCSANPHTRTFQSQDITRDSIPSSLLDTVNFLESSPILNINQSPPTLGIFLQLFQQVKPTRSATPIRVDSNSQIPQPDPPSRQVTELATTNHTNEQPLPGPDQDPTRCITNNRDQAQHLHISPSSRHVIYSLQLSDSEGNGLTRSDVSATAPSVAAPVEADPDGLFDQLALLDAAEWQASSADFVENLGISHDGSFVDFETLFS